MLVVFFGVRGAQKIARNLVLTIGREGLAESGYPKLEQNWVLPWSKISQVKVAGTGESRVIHLFTEENPQKAAHVLGGYPFDELVASLNAGLALLGKSVQQPIPLKTPFESKEQSNAAAQPARPADVGDAAPGQADEPVPPRG